MKYYKFKLLNIFLDKKNKLEYYPEGIVSNVDYEILLNSNMVSIMWMCKKTKVAFERSINVDNIIMKECSREEYEDLFKKIDFNKNNEYASLFNDIPNKEKKATFKIVK